MRVRGVDARIPKDVEQSGSGTHEPQAIQLNGTQCRQQVGHGCGGVSAPRHQQATEHLHDDRPLAAPRIEGATAVQGLVDRVAGLIKEDRNNGRSCGNECTVADGCVGVHECVLSRPP